MKTTLKKSLVIVALSTFATCYSQNNYSKGGPKTGTFVPHTPPSGNNQIQNYNNPQSNFQNQWAMGNLANGPGWGSYGNINIGFGNYPYQPYPGYGYYYGGGCSIRKSAKYAIRSAGNIIGEAIAFNTWNEIYSPILAKAIRHYNYSRQLYWWGNYNASMNHAERAGYLAWYSLQYFQNPDYYGNNSGPYDAPNPYGDPNDPYYKKANSNGSSGKVQEGSISSELPKQEKIDGTLPSNGLDDKEVIRTFDKSTLKDE